MASTAEVNAPRVFVSYSWGPADHQSWVLALATRLRSNGIDAVLDRWDTELGSDLSLFMERAADPGCRVLAIVSTQYVQKADAAEGGVGYERRVITPSLMKGLRENRIVPILRNNPEKELPRFLGAAKYIDFDDDERFEENYLELLHELHGLQATPKPPLGTNPFTTLTAREIAPALRHDPARYVMPELKGEVVFDYTNNDGRFRIGAGERTFTLAFSEAGRGSIYIYHDPVDIKTVALVPEVNDPADIGDASAYDASSRARTIKVGDAAVLRNQQDYWAAVFVDEVHTREGSGEAAIKFRYFIPPMVTALFGPQSEDPPD
ncbi:toll/interleukin-1 receptor domain-containing protein [Glycomyces sp. A-F 0318]|uniref:toll/interleukin-1 receptor domain-containing protein n=1 Tax=Glycomyces amatae TaxID=2881355 RepID=UPI001E2DD857|nr:toll/interleukin-1 receptor domain-containing protein [Glycomyces amatae]